MISDDVLNQARDMIADRIIERRNELDLTQEDLAEKAGVGIATVKRFELKQTFPDLRSLLKICYALDLCDNVIEPLTG